MLALIAESGDSLPCMLSSLEINGFRTFGHLRVDGLTRVNLFVGGNNAGKTSVLEACEVLLAGGRPWVLLRSPTRRGDGFSSEARPTREAIDIRHLFHGHDLQVGARFAIVGDGSRPRRVECEVIPAPADEGSVQTELLPGIQGWQGNIDLGPPLAVQISGDQSGTVRVLRLTEGGVLPIPLATRRALGEEDSDVPFNFIGTTDLEYRLGQLWDQILLTPNEEKVAEALRIIEPSIDRVASLSRASGRGAPSPIVVRLRGSEVRVPIGSMGDGLKRLLVLSVNLVTSAGGCLFVDEIDTGLHYSVIAQMWRLIIETASRLGVQVFASTHSLDCIQALAAVCEKFPSLGNEVAVHRVQEGSESTVRYSAQDLALAIRHEMEIR
jgi:hypothetical protein